MSHTAIQPFASNLTRDVRIGGEDFTIWDSEGVHQALRSWLEEFSTAHNTGMDKLDAVDVLTTKGDLLTFGTANTRLGVGSNGQLLLADSAQTNGIGWTNTLIAKITIDNLGLDSGAGDTFLCTSGETDGASAIGFQFDATNAMDTDGAKTYQFNSAGTEVLSGERINGVYCTTIPHTLRVGANATGPQTAAQNAPMVDVADTVAIGSTELGALNFVVDQSSGSNNTLPAGATMACRLNSAHTGNTPTLKGVIGEIRQGNATKAFGTGSPSAAVEGRLTSSNTTAGMGWSASLYANKLYSGGKPLWSYGVYIEDMQGTQFGDGIYITKQTGASSQNNALQIAGTGTAANIRMGTNASMYYSTHLVIDPDDGGGSGRVRIGASDDNKLSASTLYSNSDGGGISGLVAYTGTTDTSANSTGVGTILFKGTSNRDSVGFLKIYDGTTAYYIPFFDGITG